MFFKDLIHVLTDVRLHNNIRWLEKIMTEDQIKELISKMDTTKSLEAESAWLELRPLGESVVKYLAEAYPKMKKWQGRVSCVFHCIRYARSNQVAYDLGIAALQDRATLVRYRACGLLAYSLREDAIPHLKKLATHTDAQTASDARAAIDAITNKNHHYFVDRHHSGSTFWEVNPEDIKR